MPFELDRFLPYRLAVAAANVSQRFAERYKSEAGLSTPEWRVLAHLSGQGPVSIRDITSRVNLEKSVVSRAASRLEARSLIRKSAHDSDMRLISLELTREGKALMKRLSKLAEQFQQELLQTLGEDAATFDRALRRL
jgi:DNA-binding MarR family transcriptional regulator